MPLCPGGGIGRRTVFRWRRWKRRGGSSPLLGTIQKIRESGRNFADSPASPLSVSVRRPAMGERMSDPSPEPASATRLTLFLSYAHDDESRARRIKTALEQAGYTVWWDAMIEGGAAFARSISAALEAADVIIVLWSAASVESDWVRDEAAHGRERHRLVPLSLDRTRPPLGFRQYQFISFRRWRGQRDAP